MDRLLLPYLLGAGAVLCIPAAVLLFLFASAAADASALQMARPCATGTEDPGSSCLSRYSGRITSVTEHYRAPTELGIALQGSTVDVGYDCFDSAPTACDGIKFIPGTELVLEFWRGRVVMVGASGAQPAVLTDENPNYELHSRSANLEFAVFGVSLVLIGLLLWQSPATIRVLIATSLAQPAEPRQPISHRLIWRVAWGNWSWPGLFAWALLYVVGVIYLVRTSNYVDGLLVWLLSGLIAFGGAGIGASLYLTRLIRTSDRRTITVQRAKYEKGLRGAGGTRVWYELLNGKSASVFLGGEWSHLGHKGAQLEALTDPTSGKIRRLVRAAGSPV